ncbi:integrase [Chryseobacterium nematophagum]|uniref:Integrase n=1 Tax=Chryseobacterium nematophagum TaxID=2305228 RepID=A0A3M7TEX8_9FLAO|nr:phage integrase SAM-like domain-containing protein [Chryseobacterium nematophagum]RNA61437.1 integrase [Chryseobacterium nematophagum]
MRIEFYLPNNSSYKNIQLILVPENDSNRQNQQKLSFKIPFKLTSKLWNEEKQRPANIYLKKHKAINNKLNELKIRISEHIQSKENKKNISPQTLAKEIKKICNEKTPHYPKNSLVHLMHQYITSKKEIVCYSTYKRYTVFLNLINKFEGHIQERLYIENVDSNFLKNFIAFGKKEAYSENTISRTIHFVRTILNFAEYKGFKTAISELDIKREKQNKEIITLTEQDIIKIKKTLLPKKLHAARDWLIVSCFTGQRVSDFMDFTAEKIIKIADTTCISFKQKKTKKDIILPLHPAVMNVMDRNGNNFPKKLSYTEYNEQIKKIALIAELTEPIKAKIRTGHRAKHTIVEKWEAISSHVGRRSFATMFYGKIPTPLLMEATGHSTEQVFLKYINYHSQDRLLALNKYFNKVYNEGIKKII